MLDFIEGWSGGLSGTPTLSGLFENLSIWEVIYLFIFTFQGSFGNRQT
jgi:hypothetical protein